MTNPFTHPTDALLPHRMSVPWHDTLGYYQKRWPDRATPPPPSITVHADEKVRLEVPGLAYDAVQKVVAVLESGRAAEIV